MKLLPWFFLISGSLLAIGAFIGLGLIIPNRDHIIQPLFKEVKRLEDSSLKDERGFREFLRLKDNEFNLANALTLLKGLPSGNDRDEAIRKSQESLEKLRNTLLECSADLANEPVQQNWFSLEFAAKQDKTISFLKIFERTNKEKLDDLEELRSRISRMEIFRNKLYRIFVVIQAAGLVLLSLVSILKEKP